MGTRTQERDSNWAWKKYLRASPGGSVSKESACMLEM